MASRRKRNLLDPLLVRSSSAACVLDSEARIRFATAGFEELAGWPTEELEGLVCDPAPNNPAVLLDLLTSALAPPPAVWNGAIESEDLVLPRREGQSRRMTLVFTPLLDGEGDVDRILIVATPIESKATAKPIAQRLHAEITAMRLQFRRRFGGESLVGQCPALRRAIEQAELLASGRCGYQIIGDVGAGRQHFARLVHTNGEHTESSYVAVQCRLLQAEQLIDIFRQLQQLAEGSAHVAHQKVGTLLLHEAHECPREVQSWLLENRQSLAEGVRIVASTREPLSVSEAESWVIPEFRQLFAGVTVELPPLHQRGDDVLLLAQHFLESSRRTEKTSAAEMDDSFRAELQFYRWPGNVAELKQVMFDACQNSFSTRLTVDDLPFSFQAGLQAQQMPTPDDGNPQSLDGLMQSFERRVLMNALAQCGGNKAEAARRLGLTRPKLYRRLASLGLDDDASDAS